MECKSKRPQRGNLLEAEAEKRDTKKDHIFCVLLPLPLHLPCFIPPFCCFNYCSDLKQFFLLYHNNFFFFFHHFIVFALSQHNFIFLSLQCFLLYHCIISPFITALFFIYHHIFLPSSLNYFFFIFFSFLITFSFHRRCISLALSLHFPCFTTALFLLYRCFILALSLLFSCFYHRKHTHTHTHKNKQTNKPGI